MATTQTVNIDINANTQDAEQQVNRLENNIKTLDGAINLVGGSYQISKTFEGVTLYSPISGSWVVTQKKA